MSETSILISCTGKITREELAQIPTPPSTATHVPIPHMALSVNGLIAFCRRSLANYKIPHRIEFSETELPKSGSDKILKRVLREQFWAHQTRAVS